MKRTTTITPPKHLKLETKRWYASVIEQYQIEPHHEKLLTLACEAWDRATQAREAIAIHGIYFTDRFGAPRKHPAVSVEESARIAFARLTRELDLDCGAPATPPPPALSSNRRH
jgi:P27 family predicted phage terminase small subunit